VPSFKIIKKISCNTCHDYSTQNIYLHFSVLRMSLILSMNWKLLQPWCLLELQIDLNELNGHFQLVDVYGHEVTMKRLIRVNKRDLFLFRTWFRLRWLAVEFTGVLHRHQMTWDFNHGVRLPEVEARGCISCSKNGPN
jgi:hypothetical protein